MAFNSLSFIIFALAFFSIWPFLKGKQQSQWSFLVLASWVFYGWFNVWYVFLLVLTSTLSYLIANSMARYPAKKGFLLGIGLAGILGILAIFKYLGFITANLDALLGLFGVETSLYSSVPDFFLIVPIGISFYTFQAVSYIIDVRKGIVEPVRNILLFFAYLSMFPKLVAGPILRAPNIVKQLCIMPVPSEQMRWQGTRLIAFGLFKKVVLADRLAPIVNTAFQDLTPYGFGYWWLVIFAFALQIYFDFAGYSDMAIGLAKWIGIEFDRNFDRPYIAESVQEFWNRWHISLSSWFRIYVFMPLTRVLKRKASNASALQIIIPALVTMLLSGLWHGAAWTFVIWGGIHGFLLVIEQLTGWPKWLKSKGAVGRWSAQLITLVLVMLAWVFFRAENVATGITITQFLFDFSRIGITKFSGPEFIMITSLMAYVVFLETEKAPFKSINALATRLQSNRLVDVLMVSMLFTLSVFFRGIGDAFIYFQF